MPVRAQAFGGAPQDREQLVTEGVAGGLAQPLVEAFVDAGLSVPTQAAVDERGWPTEKHRAIVRQRDEAAATLRTQSAPIAPATEVVSDAEAAAAQEPEPTKKRGRRTKAQMLADAVIPGDDDQVKIKLVQTGERVERPWLVAVELVRDGRAEWVDYELKYSLQKMDQQRARSTLTLSDAEIAEGREDLSEEDVPTPEPERAIDAGRRDIVPPDADPGDTFEYQGKTYYVGHGGQMISTRPVAGPTAPDPDAPLEAKRHWIVANDGEWASYDLEPDVEKSIEDLKQEVVEKTEDFARAVSNVIGPVQVAAAPAAPDRWKISGGFLEKIGLPEYSSLQIGPVAHQREVALSGETVEVEGLGGRKIALDRAVVDGIQQVNDACEYHLLYLRGQAREFIQSAR
jgi:hypothetical protein